MKHPVNENTLRISRPFLAAAAAAVLLRGFSHHLFTASPVSTGTLLKLTPQNRISNTRNQLRFFQYRDVAAGRGRNRMEGNVNNILILFYFHGIISFSRYCIQFR